MKFSPETFPIILGHIAEASTTVDDTSAPICLEGCEGAFIIVKEYTAGGDTDTVLTVHEGATAAACLAGTYPISATFPIWVNSSALTTDLFTRQTDAASYTIDATVATPYIVVFYISASILTNGRKWINLGTSGGNAANLLDCIYILDGARYQPAPTALT